MKIVLFTLDKNKRIITNNKVIIIAGPTGVGKTAFAIRKAQELNADIFSADSRQIYKEMTIGTAKPALDEMKGIKHHFIDTVSIQQRYSVGDYEKDIITALDMYFKHKDVAIVCGGTGLYIDAIINGIDEFPTISSDVRMKVETDLQMSGLEFLQEELQTKDPEYFKIVDLQNPRRVTRAIEVIRQSGLTFTSFLNKPRPKRNFSLEPYILLRDRNVLYNRINMRVDEMIAKGLLDEAKSLYSFRGLRALNTVGYSELFDFINGETTLDRAIELIKQNSRRYAKRQMTWFRKKKDWLTVNLD